MLWRQMAGMRDMLIHQYAHVVPGVAWQAVRERFPIERLALLRLLDDTASDAGHDTPRRPRCCPCPPRCPSARASGADPVRSLAIFGSFARGEQTPESDLDVLVDFDVPPGGIAFVGLATLLENRLGLPVDLATRPYDRRPPLRRRAGRPRRGMTRRVAQRVQDALDVMDRATGFIGRRSRTSSRRTRRRCTPSSGVPLGSARRSGMSRTTCARHTQTCRGAKSWGCATGSRRPVHGPRDDVADRARGLPRNPAAAPARPRQPGRMSATDDHDLPHGWRWVSFSEAAAHRLGRC